MTTCPVLSILIAVVAACGQPASGGGDPPPPPPQQQQGLRTDHRAVLRYHMRMHFDDLRKVERLLVAGKLEDAKALAFFLTKPAKDPGIPAWADGTARVVDAASKVMTSPGIDEACRRVARVAQACAECHVQNQKQPSFARTSAPADLATPAARMARHQWAVDQLWAGVVGPVEESWHAGLEVLSTTPLPFSRLTDAPALASQLQKHAADALATDTSHRLDERARVYGEMLVTCAGCHSTLNDPKTKATASSR